AAWHRAPDRMERELVDVRIRRVGSRVGRIDADDLPSVRVDTDVELRDISDCVVLDVLDVRRVRLRIVITERPVLGELRRSDVEGQNGADRAAAALRPNGGRIERIPPPGQQLPDDPVAERDALRTLAKRPARAGADRVADSVPLAFRCAALVPGRARPGC